MSNLYTKKIDSFSITRSQYLATQKARELGLEIAIEADELKYPDRKGLCHLTHFSDLVLDIFADFGKEYIYSLLYPRDANQWFYIEYYLVNDELITSDVIECQYGIESAIGRAIAAASENTYSLSGADINGEKADLFVNNNLFAKIRKIEFSDANIETNKEITSLLKGINSSSTLSEQSTRSRLSKYPSLQKYAGHEVYGNGSFLHESVNNYITAFKFILEQFSANRVPRNVAEKVMWAFYEIDNEHVLRANEKRTDICYQPFVLEYLEDSGREKLHGEFTFFRNFPNAMHAFGENLKSRKISHNAITVEAASYGISTNLYTDESSECNFNLPSNTLTVKRKDHSECEHFVESSRELTNGKTTFKTRESEIVKTVIIGNKTLHVYSRNDILCMESERAERRLVPLDLLSIGYTCEKSKSHDSFYAEKETPKKWCIGFTKDEVTEVIGLGELDIENIVDAVKKIGIPVHYKLGEHTEQTLKAFRVANDTFAHRSSSHDFIANLKEHDLS